MVLSIINMCITSNCTKKLRIVYAYLLCMLNPIVRTTLQYAAIIYCISNVIDMFKSLQYRLLHTSVFPNYIEILPNPNMV